MRKRYKHAPRKASELMLVPMIDIFTVLVTFLLVTAVFSRITIVELQLPSAAAPRAEAPRFRLEVIVRELGLELTNGTSLIATIPKVKGEYDLAKLSELAIALKRDYPDAENASVLMEPTIAYDHLIQVMDAIRSAELPADALSEATPAATAPAAQRAPSAPVRVALFTEIAVGDAP